MSQHSKKLKASKAHELLASIPDVGKEPPAPGYLRSTKAVDNRTLKRYFFHV